jgi:hypothetical protein
MNCKQPLSLDTGGHYSESKNLNEGMCLKCNIECCSLCNDSELCIYCSRFYCRKCVEQWQKEQ